MQLAKKKLSARYHNCDHRPRNSHAHANHVCIEILVQKNESDRTTALLLRSLLLTKHTLIKIEIDMKYQKASFVIEIPLTCCTDVSLRSHKSSNGCAAAGSKSFVYCRNPDDVVKQHLHMQEWYRKRPSSRYGCANASITDIRLSYTRAITCHRRRKQRRWTKCNDNRLQW